jgi:hypothetical protein
LSIRLFELDRVDNLLVLQEDSGIVEVPVRVRGRQDRLTFLLPAAVDQPSRRFGQKW